jgi:hypothetical protein
VSDAPIFIVGTPRSGTTLLASMLSAHSRLQCGPETFFFSRLRKAPRSRLLSRRTWPDVALEWLFSLAVDGEPLHQQFGVSREQASDFLRLQAPSIGRTLEALTATHARLAGKARWIEKTPQHLWCIQEIRREFPEAYIVRIVRDPRDVALSLSKVPWAPDSILANVYRWATDQQAAEVLMQGETRVLTVQYETLVTEPQRVLGDLCTFVGERFEQQMLVPGSAAQAVVRSAESWKAKCQEPLDGSRVSNWKREFPAALLPAAELIACDGIRRFGYEHTHEPATSVYVYPWTAREIQQNESRIIEAADRGTRMMPVLSPGEGMTWPSKREFALSGIPVGGSATVARATSLLRFACRLLTRRLAGNPVPYVRELVFCGAAAGASEALGRKLVRAFCKAM